MIEIEKKPRIIEIEQIIKPYLEKDNFSLIEVQLFESKNIQVTIFVYHEQDATIENLGKLNKKIYSVLENIPFLKTGFTLEVSSPGIFRKIKFLEEFNIFKKREIKLILRNGNIITGSNNGLFDKELSITDKEGKQIKYNLKEINKAALNG